VRRRRPEWVPDEFSPYCANCGTQFGRTTGTWSPSACQERNVMQCNANIHINSTIADSVETSFVRRAPQSTGRSLTLATRPQSGAPNNPFSFLRFARGAEYTPLRAHRVCDVCVRQLDQWEHEVGGRRRQAKGGSGSRQQLTTSAPPTLPSCHRNDHEGKG
jgi:hypothetical protein